MLFRYFFFDAAADRLFPLAGSFGTRRRVYTFRCGGRKLFGQRVIIAAAAAAAAATLPTGLKIAARTPSPHC
jgi:hypothetical protein